jgi:primosomal protein N' (replication factor Y)
VGALLDYEAEQALPPGSLVRVPLGKREVPGIVWNRPPCPAPPKTTSCAPVAEVLEGLPPLSPAWLALVDFAAGYYQRQVGELALGVLPPELRKLDDRQLGRKLTRLLRDRAGAPAAGATEAPPTLLHGVTGSGKTEVYLHAAQRALDAGRQVLVLVPEINLTPQLEARFAERFPGRVPGQPAQRLTPAQRLNHWLLAHLGRADLVLGTRLAVFASLPRLGLIVVDEEHDPSASSSRKARATRRATWPSTAATWSRCR